MLRYLLGLLLLGILVQSAVAGTITPPVLVKREAVRWAKAPVGETATLDMATSTTFTLFVPKNMEIDADGSTTLTIHFLGASWFVCQEHERRGAQNPLLVCNAKEGDYAFELDLMKPGVAEQVLAKAAEKVKELNGHDNAHFTAFEVSSFSGGYSGVRALLRHPDIEPQIRTVLLDDSLYVSDAKDSAKDDRKPDMEKLQPYIDFAAKAVAGERTFLFEHSSTPSLRSVGPKDCSRAIIATLGISIEEVEPGSIPAANPGTDFPLIWRADKGNAHFWCYQGENMAIHLSHIRNQAEMWMALRGETPTTIVPPVMTERPIPPPTEPFPGTTTTFDFGTTYTLYIPKGYKVPTDGNVELTIHFHSAVWYAIQEHIRRGLDGPLVALYPGEGSTIYKKQFPYPERFHELLDEVVKQLQKQGAPEDTHITAVDITSFSAGYGAVREIIQVPENIALLRRVVLADSSYGSLDDAALAAGRREVIPEHVEPWANFARLAMKGDKTLLMVYSEIETPKYASTAEVCSAVVNAVGLQQTPVKPGDCRAADDPKYPLVNRTDSGSFHVWGYDGNDPIIHMTIARHMADYWEALDEAGEK